MAEGSYMETGFRINFDSYEQAFSSLFILHNESVNVWSHFLGAFCFVLFGLIIATAIFFNTFSYISNYLAPVGEIQKDLLLNLEVWPLYLHMGAAIFQMSASSYFHLFCCQNQECLISL